MSVSCILSQRKAHIDLSLYLVANRPSFQGEEFFTKIARLLAGGVTCVQLRDHVSSKEEILETARQLKAVVGKSPLFINAKDPFHSIEISKSVFANGVYLETPFDQFLARDLIGEEAAIGVPVKSMRDVQRLQHSLCVDYISVKVNASKKTSLQNDPLWGLDGLKKIREVSSHRIVAIGGLDLSTYSLTKELLHVGDGIAMAGGLMDEIDPYRAAKALRGQ